jgi:NADPH:quinone reductase-like Zn-dependent oxidoreductase
MPKQNPTQVAEAVQTMKAVRIHQYGGADVLIYEDAPRPQPAAGEVLVRVHAAGVNPFDWKVREGYMKSLLPLTLPIIPGWDVSGTVEATGPAVTRFKKGDAVYGNPSAARNGAYAEFIAVKESEITAKPASIDHVQAAGVPVAASTAWQALFDVAGLTAGQRILIHAASGGVGGSAVQLAKWKGAYVIGTASQANLDYVRSLGADEVIDYRAQRFEEIVRDVDVVLDTLGGATQDKSFQVLKKGGILVSTVQPPNQEEAKRRGVRAQNMVNHSSADLLAQIAHLIDAGRFKANVETVLPLSEARKAQELSQSGHTRGKIVLKVL